jgi:hypothetical protein
MGVCMKIKCATLVWLGLIAGCTVSARNPVANGEQFAGRYFSAKAPATGTWHLQRRSEGAITFAGGEVGNTFVAEVSMFRLAPAATPDEFEALIKRSSDPDVDVDPNHPDRYQLVERTIKYSSERSYPCVRYRGATWDTRAKGTTAPQLLEMDGLYCRHPAEPRAGAAIVFSHRGLTRHATLRDEAERFIRGVELVATK